MGKPLVNLTIAVTGDFGERRDIQKMKSWIQANGGTFAGEMSSKVTHLICSKKHYKKHVDIGTDSSLAHNYFFRCSTQLLLIYHLFPLHPIDLQHG